MSQFQRLHHNQEGWALIAGLIAAALMTLRTVLDDRTMQAELAGYKDFAQEVRYRLVPGVW